MKRYLLLLSLFAAACSDDPPVADDETDGEQISGEAVMPAPGDEQPIKNPFAPYDTGGPEAAWKYQDLTAAEKLVVDHQRVDDQTLVQSAYAKAAAGLAAAAKARAAVAALESVP